MGIIILHSPHDADSRALIRSMGVAPALDDETLDVGGLPVRVVSDHEQAVRVFPGFGRYPTLVFSPGGDKTYTLHGPTSWQQCLDFMEDPWGAEGGAPAKGLTNLTKLEFLALFKRSELRDLKTLEATNVDVALFWEEYRAATFMNLADPRTIASVQALESATLIAAGRAETILAGEAAE